MLSGTEWGNLLLWDGGFIKVEIAKKGKKPCHHVSCVGDWVGGVNDSPMCVVGCSGDADSG